jgi:hypothetical protein
LKNQAPPVNPQMEKAFVFGEKPPAATERIAPSSTSPQPAAVQPSRVLIGTRMRSDYATGLKRASLERQLEGVEPSTLQDILEEAVEPWLRVHGYLP